MNPIAEMFEHCSVLSPSPLSLVLSFAPLRHFACHSFKSINSISKAKKTCKINPLQTYSFISNVLFGRSFVELVFFTIIASCFSQHCAQIANIKWMRMREWNKMPFLCRQKFNSIFWKVIFSIAKCIRDMRTETLFNLIRLFAYFLCLQQKEKVARVAQVSCELGEPSSRFTFCDLLTSVWMHYILKLLLIYCVWGWPRGEKLFTIFEYKVMWLRSSEPFSFVLTAKWRKWKCGDCFLQLLFLEFRSIHFRRCLSQAKAERIKSPFFSMKLL